MVVCVYIWIRDNEINYRKNGNRDMIGIERKGESEGNDITIVFIYEIFKK